MALLTDDEEDSSSTAPSSPPPIVRRSKFEDEEDDSDVLESWDAAEDSEVEREKAKKAAEAKAAAEAEAAKNKKSRSQRIEERRMENMRRREAMQEETDSDSDLDEAEKRRRARAQEKESDMKHAEDLFGGIGVNPNRANAKAVVVEDASGEAGAAIDLSALKLFNPQTRDQFLKLRETLVPLVAGNNAKKAQYATFMVDFAKELSRELPSEQIKKVASGLTTLSNEKMKEEKAAEKGGKKTKAAKSKITLNARANEGLRADTNAYDDDGLDE